MKRLKVLSLMIVLAAPLAACKSNTPDTPGSKYLNVDPLKIEGFDATYNPATSKILRQSGTISIALEFDGTEDAWQAVVDEYQRLHSTTGDKNNSPVKIELKKNISEYSAYIENHLNTLNIVHGNQLKNTSSRCYNMYPHIYRENGYCGQDGSGNLNYWEDVLNEEAYVTKSSEGNTTYIMNSENLQTAWFVNKVALEAAVNYGYDVKDKSGNPGNPTTWDELIKLCDCMVKAGYTHPLGLSLSDSAINIDQFSWILRVYGDFYYRNEYKNIITNSKFTYNPKDKYPEEKNGFDFAETTFFNSILDERQGEERPNILGTTKKTDFVGAKSSKYNEFLNQLLKMRNYLSTEANSTNYTLSKVRGYFAQQKAGTDNPKDAPQIMLDYAGEGLLFAGKETANFKPDYFDYPKMVSTGGFVDNETIVRDVGGSGGYLSIVREGKSDNEINLALDFMKYYMSPYGQTIYYSALSKTEYAPKGITTVKNDLVVIPEKWSSFFKETKISFDGLVDNNPYVQNYLLGLGDITEGKTAKVTLLRNLLTDSGEDQKTVEQFQDAWSSVTMTCWNTYCSKYGWNKDCYKTPGSSVN